MDNGDVKGAVKEMQSSFDRLKFSDDIKGKFGKTFKELAREAEQFEQRANGSFEKVGDVNALKKNANNISNLFNKLTKELSQMSSKDMSEIFDIDVSGITKINKQIEGLQQKISQINSSSIEKVSSSFKELSTVWNNAGKSEFIEQLKSGDIEGASASFEKLEKHLIAFTRGGETAKASLNEMMNALNVGDIQAAEQALQQLLTQAKGADTTKFEKYGQEIIKIGTELNNAKQEVQEFTTQINELNDSKMSLIATKTEQATQNLRQMSTVAKTADDSFDRMKDSVLDSAHATQTLSQEIQEVGNRAAYFLSLENMVDLFRQGVQRAIETVKELDAAMTETAVVTDFSIGDMWDALPQYTKAANDLGTTTLGAYETMTLFYQQGLQTNEVFEIGTETMKMARIAGLEYADATNLMTAALRGFNMELNEASATKINDVYSELAAITAADTNEIATAMTKTASIASNANMEFETTAALLSQIIETTREPAETAGTAMKTIIARFTEMKKSASEVINVDGEEVNVNKVEAALRDAGVALRDVNGEFRDLDDVFLELSSKWNSLDKMTQRYVATMAAGSRQQSRFIAMMQDYDRTIELVDAAYNSAGASQKQFEKTQESLESKLNKLNNAFNTFLMGIADDKIIKGFIDALTKLINGFNKLTEGATGLGGSVLRLGTVFAGLRLAKLGVDKAVLHFVNLKKSVDGVAGSTAKLSLLAKLTERINNFKMGQGFYLNADLDTKTFEAKKAKLATEWKAFTTALSTEGQFKFTGFKVMEDGMSQLAIKSATTGKMVTAELSEAGTAALLAGRDAKEFGKELAESGMEGKVACDLIQKEIIETKALLKTLEASHGEVIGTEEILSATGKPTGVSKNILRDNSKEIDQARQKIFTLQKDVKTVETTTVAGTGSMSTAFSGLASSVGAVLPWILGIAAAIALATAAAYIFYNLSPFKKAKNEAEVAEGAVNDLQRAISQAGEETTALNSILSELEQREEVFENLVVGSTEWYQSIAEINDKLLEQIQLLEQLGYNIDYSYDENGMLQVDNQEALRTASIEKQKQQIELQKQEIAASQAAEVASMKAGYIKDNTTKQTDAYWEKSGEVMKNTLGLAGSTFAGFTAAGAALGTFAGPGPGNAIGAALGAYWGAIVAGVEVIVGSIWAAVDSTIASVNAVEEYSKEGAYAELTEDQKIALDNRAKEGATTTWKQYETDDQRLKAGQKIIENTPDAYEAFYSNEALAKQLGNKFEVADFGNSELVFNGGKDIRDEDFNEEFLRDLGYSGWEEAATALGLKYDSTKEGIEGLYTTSGEGEDQKKHYLDVSDFGQVDKDKEWDDLLSDPDTKDIDAGFLALKLAKIKGSSKGVASMIQGALDEGITEQVLYGTEDWVNATTDSFANITNESMRAAVIETVNEANAQKRAILSEITHSTKTDENGQQVDIFSNLINEGRIYTGEIFDQSLTDFASNVQRLSVDINDATARAYQAFITNKAASLPQLNGEALKELENEYYDIFSEINLEDTLGTLDSLNQMIAEGVPEAKELKENLIASGELSLSTSFEQLYKSGVLDELGEDIAKLSDEAGNIDVTATRELVDSNQELKAVMDDFNVSGYAMGKILTDIQKGEITLTEINGKLIESYKTLYSAMGQAEDVLYDLRNADLGEDYTEIGRTYEERYKTAKDLYTRGAYGSENFAGNIKSLIGDEAWTELVDKNNGSNKKAYEEAVKKYKLNKNDGNLYGAFSSFVKNSNSSVFGIDGSGKITYDFSVEGIETYDDVLDHMVKAFGVSREYAKAMLADMATYSDTLQNSLNSLNAAAVANDTYENMFFTQDTNDPTGRNQAWTEMTDEQIYSTFNQTEEWKQQQEAAKTAYEQANTDKKWEDLSFAEQKEKTTDTFKSEYKINNKVKDKDDEKEYQITKVDSFGNKYYKKDGKTKIQDVDSQDKKEKTSFQSGRRGTWSNRYQQEGDEQKGFVYDKENQKWMKSTGERDKQGKHTASKDAVTDEKTKKQLNTDAVSEIMKSTTQVNYSDMATQSGMSVEDTLEGLREIASDPIVMQMATELSTEEYDAWLAANYGENAPEIMISAGFSQESLAAVEAAKNEMITKIQAVAQALEAVEVTIPIKMPPIKSALTAGPFKVPIDLSEIDTTLTIGGEGTSAKFTQSHLDSIKTTSLAPTTNNFTPKGGSSGSGYPTGSDPTNGDSGGGGSDEENDTNPRVENANKKIEALERKLENREINEWEFQQEQEKLYAEKTAALEDQKRQLEKEAQYLNKYYKYDEETDAYVYLADAYDKASDKMKNKIDEELAKLQETNDQLNEIEDAIRDLEFKNPYDESIYYEGYSQVNNSERYLESLERERARDERYKELAGKGPEELQGVLNALFTAKEILNESKEVSYNLDKYQGLKSQINAKWNDRDFKDEEFYYWDEEAQNLVLDQEKISDSDLSKETRDAIIEEYEGLVDMINELHDVGMELDGGLVQDAFQSLAETSFFLGGAFHSVGREYGASTEAINLLFDKFEKKLGLSDKALDKFADAIGQNIETSKLLDMEIRGLGIENIEEKIKKSSLGKYLNESEISILSALGGEGGKLGDFLSAFSFGLGERLTSLANLFNFDMQGLGADLFNIGGELIEQGKQMVEKIIGYITQAVQIVVDAWTNREDYLYNFLQIIDKHLKDYEKLQREENQIEKGRTASVDEIKDNWDNQWKSLQTQLEEQQERLETRQKELERSRYSIFSLISGWDPSTDTMYENRSMKFAWDLFIGFGSAFAPMGLGSLFSSLNQLYEDYDQRVQNSYEDRLAAEQAILDIEDERLELVKKGQEETVQFEEKVMEAFMQQQQEQIEELTRLNDAIADANSKLIDTLKSNLDKMRQERENEKTEEELGEKERRLAYLRQDTSGANLNEIKKLEEQLDEGYESYTDKLIDQKISELQEQNDKAAEQRQQQIELLQGQLEYAEKYGLYWDAIYNMLYTFDEYGNAILNPDNFDLDGNIRENGALAQLLGTYTDRIGMSVWGAIADADELKYLGKIYGAFIEYNGVTGKYKNQWALDNPGANDPNYSQEQELPPGLLGKLAEAEIERKKRRLNNNPDLVHRMGRAEQSIKNFWGKLFGNDDWANYVYQYETASTVTSDIADRYNRRMARKEEGSIWANNGFSNIAGNAKNLSINSGGTQNYGDSNVNNYFNIGSVGESVSLDDMANRVANIFKNMFSTGNNVLRNGH